MPTSNSPLRYPGGKTAMAGFMRALLSQNKMLGWEYVEPFAGGAGLACKLLLDDLVSKIYLNDYDRSIYAFWKCVLYRTENICRSIKKAKFTIREWEYQRSIQDAVRPSIDDLGFSTLYLNRVNFSGVLRGGIIGGKSQDGLYKMDCRFKADNLVKKIQAIAKQKSRIKIYRRDALDFLKTILVERVSQKALVYMDPPYYKQGRHLYLSAFSHRKHQKLAQLLSSIKQRWLLTYDCVWDIHKMHAHRERRAFQMNYSANKKRIGNEILLWDSRIKIPSSETVQDFLCEKRTKNQLSSRKLTMKKSNKYLTRRC